MGRNLLLVNKYPEIIEEFKRKLLGQGIEMDIAENGIDAAILLRKKEYQVVVTGLVLEGFNGEQIISYTNKTHPDTVCIVYATNISAAQLHFLMNEQEVFRVFLRPVNFRQEFFPALEEAFEYHEIKIQSREEAKERRERVKGEEASIIRMHEVLECQKRGLGRIEAFAGKLLSYTVEQYHYHMEPAKREKLLKRELELLGQGCRHWKEQEINSILEDCWAIMDQLDRE